jgi:probable F420-dependent oxidoreductase
MKFWAALAWVDTDHLLDLARVCDASGYHGVLVSDHVFYPEALRSAYPYSATGAPLWSSSDSWPDPWVLIGAMAAATTRLRFSTNIYIAASRHPLVVAKAVSTAAVLSGNRVALGVGAGWMREEFEVLGTDFATRGKRLDEMVGLLRSLWQGGMVAHHGQYYDFDALEISPVPDRPIPIYGGGHSEPALRRAAGLDGWIGNAYRVEEALAHLDRLNHHRRSAGTADRSDYEVILGVLAMPGAELYRRFEDAGVTGMICAPWMTGPASAAAANHRDSLAQKRDAVERFATDVIAKMA